MLFVMTVLRRAVATFPLEGDPWHGVVRYGPHGPDENRARMLGTVSGKRVLVLGGGAGQLPATLATQGAKVIVVEPDPTSTELVRTRCAELNLQVELHQHDPAELAFVRAGTIDLVVSVLSLARVGRPRPPVPSGPPGHAPRGTHGAVAPPPGAYVGRWARRPRLRRRRGPQTSGQHSPGRDGGHRAPPHR